MPTHVHKFGGTSVGDPDRLRAAAAILKDASATGERTVAVSSAMSGVTNELVDIADDAAHGHLERALERAASLRARHLDAAKALGASKATDPLSASINTLCDELESIVRATAHLAQLTPRARDRLIITGEKLAVRLLARALDAVGAPATPLDADTFLDTDDNFAAAEPIRDVADREIAATINAVLADGRIPVVTGFCGRAPDGATTTLGRGGSDLSATLIAAALRADVCTIWTDVPGVFSADPRLVERPRLLPGLHYREAAEMSYYGAKVLHPRTIAPVARLRIPVLVRSSLEPNKPGTRIDATFTPESELVKAVTAITAQCLVSIEGNGMTGVPGVAARAFRALAERDVSATMISQASSEASICLAIPASAANHAEAALKQAFRDELSRGLIEEISLRDGVGIVAAVGIGMAHHHGVAGRLFSALGDAGVNILAIAQGSSELNISFAVDDADVATAVRAVHDNFVCGGPPGGAPMGSRAAASRERTDPPAEASGDGASRRASPSSNIRPLIILGCGTVGQALLKLLADNPPSLRNASVAAVADSGAMLARADGLARSTLAHVAATKHNGKSIMSLDDARPHTAGGSILDDLAPLDLEHAILVDATDNADHDALFAAALRAGHDVVTANKGPLAAPAARYSALRNAIRESGRSLRAEATVGAAIPVLATIESLLATGDTIRKIEAVLSGTLGFLTSRLENGIALSAALAEATERGYTEPDPAADLSGRDVARKATILARYSGVTDDDVPLECTPFLNDDGLTGLPRDSFLAALKPHDDPFARRIATAHDNSHVLRYTATIDESGARVTLADIPTNHPLATLRGPDNMIVITTNRFPHENPLILRGPGAGATVTATAMLIDVHRLLSSPRA